MKVNQGHVVRCKKDLHDLGVWSASNGGNARTRQMGQCGVAISALIYIGLFTVLCTPIPAIGIAVADFVGMGVSAGAAHGCKHATQWVINGQHAGFIMQALNSVNDTELVRGLPTHGFRTCTACFLLSAATGCGMSMAEPTSADGEPISADIRWCQWATTIFMAITAISMLLPACLCKLVNVTSIWVVLGYYEDAPANIGLCCYQRPVAADRPPALARTKLASCTLNCRANFINLYFSHYHYFSCACAAEPRVRVLLRLSNLCYCG